MQVTPGVFLINGAPYGRHQNSWLVKQGEHAVIIDSGDLSDAPVLPEVERNAARWGLRLEDASHLLVTHAHYDHSSHAAALQRRGLKIVASPATARSMAAADGMTIAFSIHRPFEACQPDVVLEDDQTLQIGSLKFRAIAAPGHTEGLVIFETELNGEICWFSGDLIATLDGHDNVELPWNGSPDFDPALYIRSMARLIGMPCDSLFPGHGPAALGLGKKVLEMAYAAALTRWR